MISLHVSPHTVVLQHFHILMLGLTVVVVVVVVVVEQAVVLVVLMVVEFVVGRLPRPLFDILIEEETMGLVVGILMGVGGARMELGIVVMLVEVVVLVLIDLHCWCLSCS